MTGRGGIGLLRLRARALLRRHNSRREAMAAARAAVLRCIQEGEL